MTRRWLREHAGLLALAGALLVLAPTPSYAAPCDPGQHVGNSHCTPDPPTATPELPSGVLFSAGGLALAGYLAWRRRGG